MIHLHFVNNNYDNHHVLQHTIELIASAEKLHLVSPNIFQK